MNHNIFSLLSAIVFTFIRCLTPTFSDTEFPPHDPHPSVSEGSSLKLNTSPIAPKEAGIFIRVLPVFIFLPNSSILSFSARLIYNNEVCPRPPNSINSSALFKDSSKFLDLYIAKIGDNFSCANGSSSPVDFTSPISTLISSETFNPAILAILYALCPTISAFRLPSINIIFLTLSISSFLRMYAPLISNSFLTLS